MRPSGVRIITPLAWEKRLFFASKEKRKFAALVAASMDSFEPVRKCQPESVSGRQMSERLLFLFGGHLRSFAGIEADKNNFIIATGIEREHSQHADHTLFDLIAKHGAAVINEGQDHRLLLLEIVS